MKFASSRAIEVCSNNKILQGKKKQTTSKNNYHFKGEINFQHLCNDCIKDGKVAFLTISKEKTFIGISRQINPIHCTELKLITSAKAPTDYNHLSFYIYQIQRSEINLSLEFLQTVRGKIRKEVKKTSKEISLQKPSNQPITEVKTF